MNDATHTNPKPEAPMTSDELINEFAAALRDVISEADENYINKDPEAAYVDLGCKLIFKLSGKLTIVSAKEAEGLTSALSAQRSLSILTRWLRTDPNRSYGTRADDGEIELSLSDQSAQNTVRFFRGRSVQETYAEAAQVLELARFGARLQ